MPAVTPRAPRFVAFIAEMEAALSAAPPEPLLLKRVEAALAGLIATDDWLAPEERVPSAARYQQYPLHIDTAGRFSVVSFVWAPGQTTPVHNHTVWGAIGVLQGAELCEEFQWSGTPLASPLMASHQHRLERGKVDLVSPSIGDIHRVSNGLADQPTISIHVYGADIGRTTRQVFEPSTGQAHPFVSGYDTPPALAH